MSIYLNNNKDSLADSEACYEEIASQEETYLEETEEELRAILTFDDPSFPQKNNWALVESRTELSLSWQVKKSMTEDDSTVAGDLDEQLSHAAEELIAGDSDDPPLNDEAVAEMIHIAKSKIQR